MEPTNESTPELPDMKGDWDARARENAKYYIATVHWEDDAVFDESGARDVGLFFSELEHLLTPGTAVLDIGCGIGRMDQFVAPRVGHLIGLDVAPGMIAQARERMAHLDNVGFVEGDGTTLRVVPPSSIDLVFSHVVFQHMPRSVFHGYLPEVARVLRPSGHFVFQLPEVNPRVLGDPPEDDSFEMRFYAEDEVRAGLAAAGLEFLACKRFPAGSEEHPFVQLRFHAVRPAAS